MNQEIQKSPEDVKAFDKSIKRLFKEFKVYRKIIILSIIFAILGTFLSVISPNMLADLIDEIGRDLNIIHGVSDIKLVMSDIDMEKIKSMTITLAIIYLVSAICMYIQAEKMADVTNGVALDLRRRISRKINNLHFRYFDKHSLGDILSRTTNDIDTIAQSMNQAFESLFTSIILVIGTIVMMFVTNWIMALTAIFSTLLGVVLTEELLRRSQKYFVSRQKELGNLNEHIEETYSNLKFINAYNGKKDVIEKFDKLNEKVYKANRKSQFLSGMMQPVMEFIGNFGYVAVCIVGAILTMNNMTSFGVIIAFIAYVELFTSPLTQIAQSITFLQSSAAASYRVFEFLDEKELKECKDIKTKLNKKDVMGNIEFNNVEFRYFYNKLPTIKNASFKISSGEKVAIFGIAGSGKTTLMKTLLKFNEIDSGEILIDGISIENLSRKNIHKLCTFVFQEPWIFTGTVKENILYNRKDISKKRLEEVCKSIGLDEIINKLPKKYNTVISDKYNLSAGEKQLIAIARGIIEEAPIFILDEATSNLDVDTEQKVFKAISEISKAKTLIVISHRSSVKKYVDRVMVLKDGIIKG